MNCNKELFGENRFKDFIRNNITMEPDIFSYALIDNLKTYSEMDKFNDDLCMFVFDVN